MDNINARFFRNYEEQSKLDNSSREGRAVDLFAAASGGGGYCPDGIPVEIALCLLLAGFAIAFGILYRAVTKITGGGRKRKKRAAYYDIKLTLEEYRDRLADFAWWGRLFYIDNR
jgi:hypothetical protein